ncbi:hypothetical protein JTB14_011454 [Gonioctena quinquepunctata]|nr:hypothetical protein JTB14_011454 [Gonioctena quinquepunctata]
MNESNEILQTMSNDDSDDNSGDNLQIVIESPSTKGKKSYNLNEKERDVIASIEDEIEKRLEEKAAKTKLNVVNVKNIIKQVVTNEYVLAMVRKAENPSGSEEIVPVFEPKLTRSKTKELSLPTVPISPAPWESPEPTSEVQVLFSEDLQEDSSGEEYVPGEGEGDEVGESEEDGDSTTFSNPPSVEPPPTPPTLSVNTSSDTQPNWTDDGVFKIPKCKDKDEMTDGTTIAKRTRSKLSLSSTPLEVIEETLIPPDITTDMYDMVCDNDDWMDFLQKFARPLEEVEEEEQDPDFNILADEDIDKLDKDEFRVDKAVKIPRGELNKLIAELFECVDFYSGDQSKTDNPEGCTEREEIRTDIENSNTAIQSGEPPSAVTEESETAGEAPSLTLDNFQIALLELMEQQMRQHVQMLTQNFILTYEHPELHHYSIQMKEYLLNFKYLAEGKSRSMFYVSNLPDALKLLEYWENLHAENNDDVKEMRKFIKDTIEQSIHRHRSGNVDIVTFPKLVFETISKSSVFIYPSLLPKIPFKTPKIFPETSKYYSESEDQLIALGLQQFMSQEYREKKRALKKCLYEACLKIQEYMMPYKQAKAIINHVNLCRLSRCAYNPIKYFFHHHKAPPVVQYVSTLEQLQVLPPCQRNTVDLPYQWAQYVQSQLNTSSEIVTEVCSFIPATQILTPVQIVQIQPVILDPCQRPILPRVDPTSLTKKIIKNKKIKKKVSSKKKTTISEKVSSQKETTTSEKVNKSDPATNFVKCLSRSSDIEKIHYLYRDILCGDENVLTGTELRKQSDPNEAQALSDPTMLPSMPNLRTPIKPMPVDEEENSEDSDQIMTSSTNEKKNIYLEFSTISSSSFQQPNSNTEVEFCKNVDGTQETSAGCNIYQNVEMTQLDDDIKPTIHYNELYDPTEKKDNLEEINALMTASATVKPNIKKEPSGAEKKRAKIRREFLSNLTVSTPEDREAEKQKNESFALAYYDKMRDTLELEDYHKIMQILNDYEEGDAVELYKKVEVVLRPKYIELADEFLLFLREKEAAAVDRLIPWIRMNNRSKFLRKLEIYFKDHPAQLKKIYKCLAELSQTVDISTEKIKSTLLPMFKGNEVLSDLFLQNFLDEPPPLSLMEGPYEDMDITKEMSKNDDEESCETITVPNVEDRYGGSSCICACHEIEDSEYQSRYRHCIRCGTRFINGRVYVQTGKGPRPATVSFMNSPNTDHIERLMAKSSNIQRKKDTSPSKQVASFPSKDNVEEESDDEGDGKKKLKKTPQKRRKKQPDKSPEHKTVRKNSMSKKTSPVTSQTKPTSPNCKDFKTSARKRTYCLKKWPENMKIAEKCETEHEEGEIIRTKPGSNPGQQKRLAEGSPEWGDQSAAGESPCDIKPGSPDQQTADSESEFCEESSQDNCESDSNSSVSSSNNPDESYSRLQEENSTWTREEDKVILEVFQEENDKDNAFRVIALQLNDRTVDEIKSRFDTLMKLLLETIGK